MTISRRINLLGRYGFTSALSSTSSGISATENNGKITHEKKTDFPEWLDRALTTRVLSLSTTHFGLAAPVMNTNRLDDAKEWVQKSEKYTRKAFSEAVYSGAIYGSKEINSVLGSNDATAPQGLKSLGSSSCFIFDPEIDFLPLGRGPL